MLWMVVVSHPLRPHAVDSYVLTTLIADTVLPANSPEKELKVTIACVSVALAVLS